MSRGVMSGFHVSTVFQSYNGDNVILKAVHKEKFYDSSENRT